jgi:glutamate-ammonia-ligase adenylyltransferase
MNRNEFFTEFLAAFADTTEGGDRKLIEFLGPKGYVFPARSATNLRLLADILPGESLAAMAYAALFTALPDMALNGLERISSVVPNQELLAVCTSKQRLVQFLVICGSSPFLTNIICRDAGYFRALFTDRAIEVRRTEAESLAALREFIGEETGYQEIFPLLRRFKCHEILRIAARDLNGMAPLEEVTAELSALAASCLQIAYEAARRKLVEEHGRPLMVTPHGEREADLTILGMGKFGGRELNFSSDIDLIFFYTADEGESAGAPDGHGGVRGKITLHSFFVKLGEMIARAISQVTADGYVFRVDMGLRPEGKSGDMAISQRSAEIYYESWGQSWERTAMLKARPVAGDIALGEGILSLLEPFIYRKYHDFNMIEDMKVMKQKIDASLARQREGDLNIKLGHGGIREIEFFIQSLQLVYAGRNPALRERTTMKALEKLRDARLITEEECDALRDAYRFLRTVEHRIQVVQERQTHNLPTKEDEFQALARRCGFLRENGVQRFREILSGHRGKVSGMYGKLFHTGEQAVQDEVSPEIKRFLDHRANPDLVKDMLAERRFTDVDRAYDSLVVLRDGPARARLTERARRTLEKIAPLFLQYVFDSPDQDMAIGNLERFLVAVGSRSSLYALLAEKREVLKLLVSLFGMSEFLSKILIGNPALLDSMVTRSSSGFSKSREEMGAEVALLLDQAVDFEERLDTLRRYRHEEFLRIGLNDIYGNLGQSDITRQLTTLADVLLFAAYSMAKKELTRHGRPTYPENGTIREAGLAVIALGKMGGFELNYHSDLDIIYIYDQQGTTDGEKPITNHEYFAKLGQKIISILSTQTREGYVYKIDTRLRPSGNAGPLVTSLGSFRTYHADEAQVWERQALTKARVVIGRPELKKELDKILTTTVYGATAGDEERKEIRRLRMRMENELAKESKGNYNIKTGRGGIVDVEFIVQYLQLKFGRDFDAVRSPSTVAALKAFQQERLITDGDAETLLAGYKFLRHLENRLRIIHDYSMNDLSGSPGYLDKLARRLGYDPKLRHPGELFMADYEKTTSAIRDCFDRVFGEE